MPALRPLAGFSPNCCAVRVQTEHWAVAGLVQKMDRLTIKTAMIKILFMTLQRYYSVKEKFHPGDGWNF